MYLVIPFEWYKGTWPSVCVVNDVKVLVSPQCYCQKRTNSLNFMPLKALPKLSKNVALSVVQPVSFGGVASLYPLEALSCTRPLAETVCAHCSSYNPGFSLPLWYFHRIHTVYNRKVKIFSPVRYNEIHVLQLITCA